MIQEIIKMNVRHLKKFKIGKRMQKEKMKNEIKAKTEIMEKIIPLVNL